MTADDLALLVSPVHADQLRVDEDDLSETGRLADARPRARRRRPGRRARARCCRCGSAPSCRTRPPPAACSYEHGDSARERCAGSGHAREWGVKLVRRLDAARAGGLPAGRRAGVTGTEYLARRRRALDQHDGARGRRRAGRRAAEEAVARTSPSRCAAAAPPAPRCCSTSPSWSRPDAEAGFLATAGELRQRLEPDGLGSR